MSFITLPSSFIVVGLCTKHKKAQNQGKFDTGLFLLDGVA